MLDSLVQLPLTAGSSEEAVLVLVNPGMLVGGLTAMIKCNQYGKAAFFQPSNHPHYVCLVSGSHRVHGGGEQDPGGGAAGGGGRGCQGPPGLRQGPGMWLVH